jgi:TRAP-type C4-dicarboxylate transport system substrate-binding protein
MRRGELDAALLTGAGLSPIDPSVLVLQMPGLFDDWTSLDRARTKMEPDFDFAFHASGFAILGWSDFGVAHVMSRGADVRAPGDLKGRRCLGLAGDAIAPVLYGAIGEASVAAMMREQVAPALESGALDVVSASSLVTEQLLWAQQLDHVSTLPSGMEVGALVAVSASLDALPADLRRMVVDSGGHVGSALAESVRHADDAAFARLRDRMTTYEPSTAEREQWKALFRQTRERLRGTVVNAEVFDEAEQLAAAR